MIDEELKAHIEQCSERLTSRCHNWGQDYPLLIGQCECNVASFCKEKPCWDVTVDDWRTQMIKDFGLERLYKAGGSL